MAPERLADSAAELPLTPGEPGPSRAERAAALSVPEGSFTDLPPAGGADPLDPTVESFDPASVEPVSELVSERTAVSELWENADGSFSTRLFSEPRFFQPAGSTDWLRIDTTLVPDVVEGWVRSSANEWAARFGPLGPSHPEGGVEVTTADGQVITQTPADLTEDVVPVVEGSTVTYPLVWPGVDLVYTVTAGSVKEDLVVHERPDRSEFAFNLDGVALTAEGAPPGALVAEGAGAGEVALAAPEVLDRQGRPVDGTALPSQRAEQTESGSLVFVSVDPAWLDGLADSAFPVTVDPTLILGSYAYWDYASNGWNGTYSGLRVGNSQAAGDVYWRSVAYFDYTSLLNSSKDVLTASVAVTVNGGTTTDYGVGVQGNTCSSGYSCLQPGWDDVQTIGSTGTMDVTGLYDSWVASNVHNGHLWFGAAEVPGLYNYKSLALSLTIVWNTLPDMANPTAPAEGQVLTTTQPTLSVTPVTDPDGDAVWYAFRVATGTDGESGAVANSGWMTNTPTWTPPTGVLRDGVTYSWRVFTYDTKSIRNPTWVRTFKVDQRLGAGGPSPMDAAGPVGVNLATGNVTTTISTPTVSTLGGGIGLSFTYNSQAARQSGLSAGYYQDWNANKAFDSGELWNTRVDPQVSFNWGTGAPMPGMGADGFLTRWNGYITMPTTGTYTLGTRSDDGVRVYLDAGNLWRDDWNNQGMSATPEWANWGVAFNGGGARAVQVDYFEGAGAAGVELWVKDPNGWEYIVPSDWLSTSLPGVPDGWTMSAGAEGGSAYVAARVSDTSIVLVGGDASTYEYKRAGTGSAAGFTPPAGSDDTLSVSPDGTYVVQADDGYTYTFRVDGLLESVTSALDDRQPAAVTYTYSGSPAQLTSMTDPVSGRAVTLRYGGGNCPAPTSGFSSAPSTMLCQVDFSAFDPSVGGSDSTDLLYDAWGRLVRVVNPGGVTTDLAYESSGLAQVLDPLAADAVAAGYRANDVTARTKIDYVAGRASGVTLPAPLAGAARPARTYAYTSATETRIHVAGLAETAPNLWARKVTVDGAARTLTDTDAAGFTTSTQWDAPDRPLRSTDPAGLVTTSVYNKAGRVTDTYGPGPASCFVGQTPDGSCTNPPVGHAHTDYDQSIGGLAATYWDNKNLSGAPVGHGTQLADNAARNWGASKPDPSVTATEWSARYTGEITVWTTGIYTYATWAASGIRVWLDDQLLVNMWTDPAGWTRSPSPDPTFNNTVAGSKHRIRIDVFDTNNSAAMELWVTPPGGSWGYVPGSVLSPSYGLVTTTTTDESNGVPAQVTATGYATPHLGLATSTTTDPAGLALTSTTTYEAPGSGYLRRKTRTLPAGAASQVTYDPWGATEVAPSNSCVALGVAQGGLERYATSADPDGVGSLVGLRHETIRDKAGRPVAHRLRGHDGTSALECTTYDTRGRVVATTDRDGRTSSVNYSNPLQVVTTYQDSSGTTRTTTTELDLLGRTIGYTDELGTRHTFTFDQAGRPVDTNRALAGQSAALLTHLDYDPSGRLWKTHDYGSGSDQVTTYAYDATSGRPTTTTLPNGVVTTAGYDPANGGVKSLTHTQGQATVASASVTRSASGRITGDAQSDSTGRTLTRGYSYDAAGRLTTAVDSGNVSSATRNYTFDANSNRLCVYSATPCASPGYAYDTADRLTSSPGWFGYAYDQWGNQTSATPTGTTPPTSLNQTLTVPTSGAATTPVLVGSAGTASFNATWPVAPPSTTSSSNGSLLTSGPTSIPVTVLDRSSIGADLSWTDATRTLSSTGAGNLTAGGNGDVLVTPTATGQIAASVDWESSARTDTYSGTVATNATADHTFAVSGDGPVGVTLTFPLEAASTPASGAVFGATVSPSSSLTRSFTVDAPGVINASTSWADTTRAFSFSGSASVIDSNKTHPITVSANGTISATLGWTPTVADLDLQLLDASNNVIATAATAGQTLTHTVSGLAYPATRNYTLRVIGNTVPGNYTLTGSYPVAADVDIKILRGTTTVATAAGTTARPETLAYNVTAETLGGYSVVATAKNDTAIANLTYSYPVPKNLDIALREGSTELTRSTSSTATTETVSYTVSGLAYPSSRTLTARVIAVGEGTSYSVAVTRPVTANVNLQVRDAGGNVVASSSSTTAKPETVAYQVPAGQVGQAFTIRAISADHPAAYTTAVTYPDAEPASVTLRLKNPAGTVIATTTGAANALSLRQLVTSAGAYTLEVVNNSSTLNVPTFTLARTVTTVAESTFTGSATVLETRQHTITVDGAGWMGGTVTWTAAPVGGRAPLTIRVLDPTGAVLSTATTSTGSYTFGVATTMAGAHKIELVNTSAVLTVPSYTVTVNAPRGWSPTITMVLRNAAGQSVASMPADSTSPGAFTASVSRGSYSLEVSANAATTVTVTGSAPAAQAKQTITYDGNDHATSIDDGTYLTAETLTPSGRVLRREVTNQITGTSSENTQFGYAGSGDSPAYSIDSTGTVTTYGPGGAVHRTGQPSTWPLTNPHGDLIATTNTAGTVAPVPLTDEYGVSHGADTRDPTKPENRLGWLGQHQRYTTSPVLGIIRMGVRLYNPTTGRFLEVDPIEGGSANDYDYVNGDPINQFDLDGHRARRRGSARGGSRDGSGKGDPGNSGWCGGGLRHPSRINQCRLARRDAAWAGRRSTALAGGDVGRQNALRHCMWSASMTMDMGSSAASGFLTRHEQHTPTGHDHEVDLFNNKVGTRIGNRASSRNGIESSCVSALDSGGLDASGG